MEDFSVTTNALGTPKTALEASREACYTCHHYPPANQEPSKTSLARFIWPNSYLRHKDKLLIGNGASELIDLVIRSAPKGPWKPGPWDIQYKEYQRSAENNDRVILHPQDKTRAMLTCIVNPCNPTGDYLTVEELKQWIPWLSSEFRSDSLTSQHDFINSLYETRKISIYIIHSWTKIWSCTGLRIGSVVCPTNKHCDILKRVQIPWSVNSPALAFLDAVVKDNKYMEQTWEFTIRWRKELINRLRELSNAIVKFHNDEKCEWIFYGKDFLSWVWIDMRSIKIAEDAVSKAKFAGVPVRSGNPGYNRPTYVRVAVREPSKVDILIKAWATLGTQ
ncbi:2526_t:CDS:2 [Diversispora eburnea]|uniref:2526_t:CDS:1 n=1 Tax=Diversispora eburnea TaxID=1213867 RepID=A0A9N8VLV4_9GLOM|nr:2526_t:CDS:2 [Diversispora eburnea]